MILAGDVGGTKTLLGVFDRDAVRPRPVRVAGFATLDYRDLSEMIEELTSEAAIRGVSIDGACFGVAGPVIGDTAALTNVPWMVDARTIASRRNRATTPSRTRQRWRASRCWRPRRGARATETAAAATARH